MAKINELNETIRNNRDPPKDCSGVEKLVKTFTEKLMKNSKADVSSEYDRIKLTKIKPCKKLNDYVDELKKIVKNIEEDIKELQAELKSKWK